MEESIVGMHREGLQRPGMVEARHCPPAVFRAGPGQTRGVGVGAGDERAQAQADTAIADVGRGTGEKSGCSVERVQAASSFQASGIAWSPGHHAIMARRDSCRIWDGIPVFGRTILVGNQRGQAPQAGVCRSCSQCVGGSSMDACAADPPLSAAQGARAQPVSSRQPS
jgi:hypothetical protein